MRGLKHRLEEYLPRATHSEDMLIRWLSSNLDAASEMSVRELADAAGVSPSTIWTRFQGAGMYAMHS